jgi:hypothetical protein
LILRKLLEGKDQVWAEGKLSARAVEKIGEQTPGTVRKVWPRQEEIVQTARVSREEKTTAATHNTHNTEQSEE